MASTRSTPFIASWESQDLLDATAPLDIDISHDRTQAILTGTIEIGEAERWWPHTHGAQPRYRVALEIDGAAIDLASSSVQATRIVFQRAVVRSTVPKRLSSSSISARSFSTSARTPSSRLR